MSTRDEERINLLSGPSQPQYALFRPSAVRRSHRRLRQFQCCLCSILLSAIGLIFAILVIYSINQEVEGQGAEEVASDGSDGVQVLLTVPWPLSDVADGGKKCAIGAEEWQRALSGSEEALNRAGEGKDIFILDTHNPSYVHQKAFVSSNESRRLQRVAFVAENAYRTLLGLTNLTSDVCQIPEDPIPTNCNPYQKYATFDGTCNNLDNPSTYGVAFTPFRRALPPTYADGVNKPRVGKGGLELPTARTVSLIVHRPLYRNDEKFTVMLAVWGQFVDHDVTATALTQNPEGIPFSCCAQRDDGTPPACFPVHVDKDDPYYKSYNVTCLDFVRSAAALVKNRVGPRQQLNQVSAFLDGSAIYGSTVSVSKQLRTFKDGLLKMFKTEDNRTLLPISMDPFDGCNRKEQSKMGRYCFLTGDQRANENIHLTSMHLIWARQHNFLASQLKSVNPRWGDEEIFQEARRIVAAQIQHITYNEFLSIILGPDLMRKTRLEPKKTGYSEGYNKTLDPSVANNFATAAFRFGHTLIPALIKFLKTEAAQPEYVQLHKMLFNPFVLYKPHGLDGSLRGALNTSIEAADTYFNAQLKNHLFEGSSNKTALCGLDLVSLNIQRGRDHGLPSYPQWRKHCGLSHPQKFSDLKRDIDEDSLERIEHIYRDVEDVDLYTGGVSEKPIKGSILGPTFTCLILDQFVRLKRGDRFWYENPKSLQSFTSEQLDQIRQTTLARIICDNSDGVDHVQLYVMRRVDRQNKYLSCRDVPQMNLMKWRENLTHINISDESMGVAVRV